MIFEKEDNFAKNLLQSDKMKIPTRKPYLAVYTLDKIDPVVGRLPIEEVVWAFNETGVRRQVADTYPDCIVEFESIKRFRC